MFEFQVVIRTFWMTKKEEKNLPEEDVYLSSKKFKTNH